MTPISKVNLAARFARFDDHWHPRIVGALNDSHIKLVKVQGEFIWHHHEQEDELFLVVRGRLLIRLHSGDMWIEPGEFVIIPHGVEHQPVAEEETWVLLLEPQTTVNTGSAGGARTVEADWI